MQRLLLYGGRLCRHQSEPLPLLQQQQQRRFKRKRADQYTPVLFGEVDARGGYPSPYRDSLTLQDRLSLAKQAWLDMPNSAAQLRDFYMYDRVPFKPPDLRHGDYYYLANFPRDGGHSNWVVTADSHYGEGYSRGEFSVSSTSSGTGLFSGQLSTAVPQIGVLARAGFVNLRSPSTLVMGRPRPVNIFPLNCIVMRYRGDGRKYKLNMHSSPLGKLDINLFDLYSFPLYSRGGPYWTVCKIPVSKLIRLYKGRAQDKPVLNNMMAHQHLSITLSDNLTGPFSLEIDYIAAYYDMHLNEKFAYEVYPISSLMKNNLTY